MFFKNKRQRISNDTKFCHKNFKRIFKNKTQNLKWYQKKKLTVNTDREPFIDNPNPSACPSDVNCPPAELKINHQTKSNPTFDPLILNITHNKIQNYGIN